MDAEHLDRPPDGDRSPEGRPLEVRTRRDVWVRPRWVEDGYVWGSGVLTRWTKTRPGEWGGGIYARGGWYGHVDVTWPARPGRDWPSQGVDTWHEDDIRPRAAADEAPVELEGSLRSIQAEAARIAADRQRRGLPP